MHENHTFSSFYSEPSDVVNCLFNLGESIHDFKVVRKILRYLLKRFTPKVIVIKESKEINSMRVDELVGSIQTYEMTLPSSKKLEDSAFKASKNKKKYIKMSYDITRDELAHIAKTIKKGHEI